MNESQSKKQYWLWVTGPEYYLDEDGQDLQSLDPAYESDTSGWWTCDRRTRQGDLVFLYRTSPKMDIAYLMQATSDAFDINDDYYTSEKGWDYGCEFRVMQKLQNPITIQDLRKDKLMRDWPVLKAQFRRRSWAIASEYWERLNELAQKSNRGYETAVEKVQKSINRDIAYESELEEALFQDLTPLKKFGYDLEIYNDRHSGKKGKQFICSGKGGRIDLLCYDRKKRKYVVIELKNVSASQKTIGQIMKYMGWVSQNISKGSPVLGLVISRGTEPEFELGLLGGAPIESLDLKQLGFR
jgi:hypothetical protein